MKKVKSVSARTTAITQIMRALQAAAVCICGVMLLWSGESACGTADRASASEIDTSEDEAVVYEAAGWQISLKDTERTASLNTVSVSLGYSSVETTDLEQSAEEGYEYCLLKLSFTKADSTEEIDWENVTLTDADGNSYSRIEDSFLEDYGMARIPGTNLNFGSYEGWICFEIPENADDLQFVCSFAEEELVIPVELEEDEEETESESETTAAESETAAVTESETAAAESETAEVTESGTAVAESETAAGNESVTESETSEATNEESEYETAVTENAAETETAAAESETTAATETEIETETETETETEEIWTEIDYEDYLEEQSAIDAALYAEAQNGYSFENPFVVVNPYGNSPLTAMVTFMTEEETGVEIVVCGKSEENNITASFEADTTHILPIYGLYAGETTEVVLTLDDGSSTTLEITTEALNGSITEAEVTVYDESVLTDGALSGDELTFALVQTVMEGDCGVVAYDNAGDIRWYMGKDYVSGFSMKRLSNGRMMASTSDIISGYYYSTGLVEFDLYGKFYAIYLIPGGEHHDFVEMENGNLLVCSCTEDFSTVEDRIVEVDRETGEIVYELNIADLIEPGDGGSENATEEDWCHNNSIDYDEESDTILLSCRHLDAVLAINKTEKELVWILGDPNGFTSVSEDLFFTPVTTVPTDAEDSAEAGQNAAVSDEDDEAAEAEQKDSASDVQSDSTVQEEDGTAADEESVSSEDTLPDFEWQYAQHNAIFLPNGDILLFDNGTHRTKVGFSEDLTMGDDVYSRAVRYHIDTETMTIEQVWTYGEERGEEWYSSYISGADYLDEDTYWITSGANSYSEELDTYDLTIVQAAQGERTTYIDLVVGDELAYEMTIPATTYRSLRMSLYTEENTYSVTEEANWYGSLGSVAQADADNLTVAVDGETTDLEVLLTEYGNAANNSDESGAAVDEEKTNTAAGTADTITSALTTVSESVNFTLSELMEMPDRLVVSGSWAETGEDASLVLVNESGDIIRYSIDASATSTVEGEVDFDLWITADSVEAGHRYYIYLYNQGVLYRTGKYWNVYVDTRESVDDEGAQYALYDVDGQEYTALSSEALSAAAGIETDLETELTMSEQTQAISDAIVTEVENNGYTFENPLVIQNPYQNTPLTAVVAFETDEACEVRVTVKGKTEEQEQDLTELLESLDGLEETEILEILAEQESVEGTESVESAESQDITDVIDAATLHIIPVLGLYAGYDNEVVLELLDADGNATETRTITITTEALPSALQGEVETDTYTTESSMGLMLVSGLSAPYAYAFDETGEIRWYCTVEWEYYGLFMLDNGHFLMEAENVLYPNASMPNSAEFWEMDYLGRVYNVYYFPEGVHHDIQEMTENGNFLILTNSNDGYEQNMIQEIDRETGEAVKSLNLNDLFEGLDYIDRDD